MNPYYFRSPKYLPREYHSNEQRCSAAKLLTRSRREHFTTDTGPLFVSSSDLVSDRRYKAAVELAARGDLPGAADVLTQTVEAVPGFATAWFALGAIRDRIGDRDGAEAAFHVASRAEPEDYHGARLQLARLGAGDERTLSAPAIRPICGAL